MGYKKRDVYIKEETNKWIEHLNLNVSELVRDAVESERDQHIAFMKSIGKEVKI